MPEMENHVVLHSRSLLLKPLGLAGERYSFYIDGHVAKCTISMFKAFIATTDKQSTTGILPIHNYYPYFKKNKQKKWKESGVQFGTTCCQN